MTDMADMTREQLVEVFTESYHRMYHSAQLLEMGDPFSYARSREMRMAIELGHNIAPTLSGADAYNQNGDPMEYKSTIGAGINGTYNGISKLSTWAEQEEYLRHQKLGCYSEHYFARFVGSEIVEMWMLTGDRVCEILIPKLAKKYPTQHLKKDPRLGATINKREIYTHGKRIK